MALDPTDLPLSDSSTRVLMKHQLKKIRELVRDELARVLQLAVERAHEHLILICRVKRRQAGYHLIEDGAQ